MTKLVRKENEREQWREDAFDGAQEGLVDSEELAAPLGDLPPVEFAFAYGSGVFAQHQPPRVQLANNEAPAMVDYILGVTGPAEWHSQNLEQNPHHYASWLARFGGKAVSSVAENVGVGVHFNAFVPWQDKTIKYGVISVDNLVKDVSTWERLYISGRLQKPVKYLVDQVRGAELNHLNLQSAVAAALLLLPSEFSEEDLYATICGLSYMGDVRMLFAEDKNKVRKIVQGSASQFQVLYEGVIQKYAANDVLQLPPVHASNLHGRIIQDGSISTRYSLLRSLPLCVLQQLARQTGTKYHLGTADNTAVAHAVVKSQEGHAKMVARAVRSIVRASSFRQMISGFLAAGGVNAAHYVARKVNKAWQSRH